MDNLTELLRSLKYSRVAVESLKARKAELMKALLQSPEYELTNLQLETEAAILAETESAVKTLAVEKYKLEKVAKVHPFITVKNFTVTTFKYDKQKAHEWALTHNTGVLDLNTKEFERVVEANKVPAEIATFESKDDPRAQIAADLGKLE